MLRKVFLSLLAGAAAIAAPSVTMAQGDYPNREVRLVVPYPPGGSADLIGRMIADKLSKSLGQTVFVDNKGGASGAIGSEIAARSKPDGYTLLLGISDTHALGPAVSSNLPYHPRKDFTPISLLAVQPLVLAVGPSMKAKDLKGFVEAAKAKPGGISYASNGTGGLQHLAMELLGSAAGVKALHIPYRGSGPALADVMGGHVDALMVSIQGSGGNFGSGKLRPLAITSAQRLAILPDTPTVAEAGYPGFEVSQWYGLFAPAGLDPALVAKLNAEVKAAMASPDIADKLRQAGTEPIGGTAEDFATFLDKDIAQWADVAKKNNIKVD